MANRFDTYVQTQYVPSPVEYYRQAVGAAEQEGAAKLQDLGQAYDTAYNIDAAFNPDKELRNELLGNLRTQVEEVAKGDTSTPEAMLKLKRLVSDRNLVDQLSGIQGNTATYGRLMEESRKYKKEYGNEYNVTPIIAQMAEYNKLGKEGYQKGFLQGTSVDKYTDVIGEMRKVLKEVGADTSEIEEKDGRYWVKVKNERKSLDKLMATAGIDLQNPAYANQIKNILFHNAYTTGGGDVKKGLEAFHKSGLENMDEQIKLGEQQLASIDRKAKGGDKLFEQTTTELKRLRDERDAFSKNKDYEGEYSNRYLQNMALMAAQPFVTSKYSRTYKPDAFELANLNHQNALARQKAALKTLMPPEVPLITGSGSTGIIGDKRAIAFNQTFGDLKVDEATGMPVMSEHKMDLGAGEKGPSFYQSTAALGGIDITKPSKKTYDNEWDKFIDQVGQHGFNIDKAAIKDPKNPRHQEEMRKMGVYYKQMKANAEQDEITSYGIDLGGAGMSADQVSRYVVQRINNNLESVVEVADDLGIEKKKLRDVIGSKDSNDKLESINNKDIVATYLPMRNKIAVSYKQGKTFFIDPDTETQQAMAPLTALYNTQDKITEVPVGGKHLLSYNTFDQNMRPVKDVMQAVDQPRSAEEMAQIINKGVGTWAWSPKVLQNVPENEITVFSRDPRTGASQQTPYYKYVQGRESDPDYYDKVHKDAVAVIKRKNPNTKKVTYQLLQEHTDANGNPISAMQMIKDQTGERFKPGSSLSGLIDRSNPLYHEKYSQFLMGSGFEGSAQINYNDSDTETTE